MSQLTLTEPRVSRTLAHAVGVQRPALSPHSDPLVAAESHKRYKPFEVRLISPNTDQETNDGFTEASIADIGKSVRGEVGLGLGDDPADRYRLVMPADGQFSCRITNTTPPDAVSAKKLARLRAPEIYNSRNDRISGKAKHAVQIGKRSKNRSVMVTKGQEIFSFVRSFSKSNARYLLQTSFQEKTSR